MSKTDRPDDSPSPTEAKPIAPPPSDEEALLQNFLTVDHPNKGQLFKDLMSKMNNK